MALLHGSSTGMVQVDGDRIHIRDDMLTHVLAFLGGICLLQVLPVLPAHAWMLLPPAVLALFTGKRWLALPATAVLGFVWAWIQSSSLMQQQLPHGLQGRDVLVRGSVQESPQRLGEERLRFRFRIDSVLEDERWRPLDLPVRLNWYRDSPTLVAGERWQLQVRLKQPNGYFNPGGFDYERWLFAHRIRATGYVRATDTAKRLRPAGFQPLHDIRQQLLQFINGHPQAGLLAALGTGDRSAISAAQWQVLRDTGTSHLVAISGLHVGLAAMLSFALVRVVWQLAGVPGNLPATRVAALAALVVAALYALLSGFQVPAQRALVMVAVWMILTAVSGAGRPWQSWSIALTAVLLFDSLSVLTAGFWLSFGAVAWLIYLGDGRHGPQSRWKRMLYFQLGLSVGLVPLLWLWFGQVSLVSPLANLVAIPWISLLVVPTLLLALISYFLFEPLAGVLLDLAGAGIHLLWQVLDHLSGIAAGNWYPAALPAYLFAVLLLVLAGLLAPRHLPLRLPALVALIPLALHARERPGHGDVWLTLLDVGQGLAAVVETRRHVLVYDTGPAFPGGLDSGEAVVVPFLRWSGRPAIDTLVISHGDNDHAGGEKALRPLRGEGALLAGEPQRIKAAGARSCQAGQQWTRDGVSFHMLSPLKADTGNNASCVLRVETGQGRVLLLPGDIERRVENRLLALDPDRLKAEVLIAPHHGSLTSSGRAFVDAVDPSLVLFAAGYANRYGFPRQEVVQRYRDLGARGMQTSQQGAITVYMEKSRPLQVRAWRSQRARYWNRKATPGS